MNPITAYDTISKQFTRHEAGLLKLEFDVNASSAATVYVQIHDFPQPADLAAGLTVPANGTVPIKTWATPAGSFGNYKEFKRGELEVTYGLFVCVSTTRATLTIGTGNNKFDEVSAELESTDVVGSEVSGQGATTLLVWTAAAGVTTAHRLVRAVGTNLEAGIRYLQLFAVAESALSSGVSVPVMSWQLSATGDTGDTKLVSFGGVGNNNLGGIDFKVINATGTHNGCTIALSSTPTVFTQGTVGNFYAEYK